MAEEKEESGINGGRVGLGLLTGVLASYLFPYYPIFGRAAIAARALFSAAYTGLAAIVNKLVNPKEKTTAGTALGEGVAHFAGRTLGDHLRHYAWYYAPRFLY